MNNPVPRISPTKPSQAAIGRALGLSRASITKYKAKGMPLYSVAAARRWRELHTAPTMHRRTAQHSPRVRHAVALMNIAAATLEAGLSITPMVPTLRQALRNVPATERSDSMRLPSSVLDALVADVQAALEAEGWDQDSAPGSCNAPPMADDEANEIGIFWYGVAAGEIRPAPRPMV